MKEYQEIKIPDSQESVTIELDDIDDVQEVTLEEAVPKIKEDAPVKAETEQKHDPKKGGSSAQRRIRELNSRMKEAELRALEAEQKAKLLESKLKEDNTSAKEDKKNLLETNIKVLTARLKEAMENSDFEAVIDIQDKLTMSRLEHGGLIRELEKKNESVEESKQKIPAPQIPDRALDWIEEYPQFKTDEIFRSVAIVVNNQLIREGFDTEEEDFYTELNARLKKRFPEIFGVKEKNVVESEEITSDDDTKDVKQKSPTKARVTEQTVSGSSRPSSTNITTPAKKSSIVLSPADIAQAEKWGLTLEQMARRMAHLEKSKTSGTGYAPIKIN